MEHICDSYESFLPLGPSSLILVTFLECVEINRSFALVISVEGLKTEVCIVLYAISSVTQLQIRRKKGNTFDRYICFQKSNNMQDKLYFEYI